VLADVGGHKGIALRDLPELLHDKLGFENLGLALVLQTVAQAPLLELLPPGRERLRIGSRTGRLELRQDLAKHLAYIPHNGHVDFHALGDR